MKRRLYLNQQIYSSKYPKFLYIRVVYLHTFNKIKINIHFMDKSNN